LSDTISFIGEVLPAAVGFETQKELTKYAHARIQVAGQQMELGKRWSAAQQLKAE